MDYSTLKWVWDNSVMMLQKYRFVMHISVYALNANETNINKATCLYCPDCYGVLLFINLQYVTGL